MYLYRFDPIKGVAAQRNDPNLRARRIISKEVDFAHYQINDALDQVKPGEGVYRISFWKSWESLISNLWAHQEGALIQRIKKTHPIFSEFNRGDDQYLEKDAWLYWATLPINENNPNWSAIGIHHSEIEVLHPIGRWIPISMVPAVGIDTYLGWHREYFQSSFGPAPIYFQTALRATNGVRELWCLIRQPSGPWKAVLSHHDLLAMLIKRIQWNHRHTAPFIEKWAVVLEDDERIFGYEVEPTFLVKASKWQYLIRKYAGLSYIHSPFNVGIASERNLSQIDIDQLYDDFGISEALRRGKAWRYDHLINRQHSDSV